MSDDPQPSTVLRWCQKRNRYGIKMQSSMIGGRRVTSVEAVRRYNQATTLAADSQSVVADTNPQQRSAHESAVREPEEEGL